MSDRSARLVGRDAELAALDRLVARAAGEASHPARPVPGAGLRTVAVVGDPGIGKTRLLTELRALAADRGLRVVSGQAAEYEEDVPFAVVAAALGPLAARSPELVDGLPPGLRAALAAVLPSSPAAGRSARSSGRHLAYAAVGALLERAAAPNGLLVVLDDLHWADEGSVELVSHLLEQSVTAPVVLAVGYRPRQAPARLASALVAARGTVRFDLAPLSEDESLALLGPVASRPVARELHALAGGNPLYLTALAAAGARTGISPVCVETLRAAHEPHALPADGPLNGDLRAMLRRELDGLPDPIRTVAQAAAVLGTVAQPALAAVAELPEPVVLDALDELVRRDLLRPAEDAATLRFRHPLVRHIAYEDAGAGWRLAAHGRAARVLADAGAPVEQWAHHVERSAAAGDEAAVRVLERAGAATRLRAPATAARWYAAALRLLPVDQPTGRAADRRARLLLARAEALAVAGDLVASRDVVDAALATLGRRQVAVRRRATTVAARVEQLLGRYDEAVAVLRGEMDRLADPDGSLAAALRLEVAAAEVMRGDFATARATSEQVLASPGGGARALAAHATGILALTRYTDGDPEGAAAAADAAGALVDAMPDGELVTQLAAVVWLGWTDMFLGRHPRAQRRQERALTLARATGQASLLTHLLVGQGSSLRWVGRLPDALACFEEAHDVARLSGSDELLAMAATMVCRIHTWLGDVDAAMAAGVEAVRVARASNGWFAVLAPLVFAQARLEAGQPGGCTEAILDAAGGAGLPRIDRVGRPDWYELLTRASLAAGERRQAADWAAAATDSVGLLPSSAAFAALAEARVDLAFGRHGRAAERAAASSRLFAEAGNPLDQARARLVAGRALAGTNRSAAAEELTAAERTFAVCGAARLRAEAVKELRRVGRRPHRSSRTPVATLPPVQRRAPASAAGTDSLTDRERQVADLVARGLTNRQVAKELFLSDKTVERHLAHIFTKLGVATRTELAGWVLARAG